MIRLSLQPSNEYFLKSQFTPDFFYQCVEIKYQLLQGLFQYWFLDPLVLGLHIWDNKEVADYKTVLEFSGMLEGRICRLAQAEQCHQL